MNITSAEGQTLQKMFFKCTINIPKQNKNNINHRYYSVVYSWALNNNCHAKPLVAELTYKQVIKLESWKDSSDLLYRK